MKIPMTDATYPTINNTPTATFRHGMTEMKMHVVDVPLSLRVNHALNSMNIAATQYAMKNQNQFITNP